MARFLGRRVFAAIITTFVVVVVVFFIFQIIGDPARRTLPLNASEEQIAQYRDAMGFSDPIIEQFLRYFSGVLRLDFGVSTTTGDAALESVLIALPRSLLLAVAGLVVTVVVGLVLGTVAGLNAGGRLDRVVQKVGSAASATPEFWSGLMLIILFGVMLKVLPTGGYGGVNYLILPAIAMAIPPIGRLTFVVRESVRATAAEPFVLVARSKGLAPQTLIGSHILRAALVPIVSLSGVELTRMLIGGVVVVEAVFSWPGIGSLYLQAMERYDVPLASATLFVATVLVLVLNLILDVLYTRLDPRIRLTQS